MCGICGAVWSGQGEPLGEAALSAMMDRLVHRGPDDSGVHRDGSAALGFRRLSIIDLEGGHQPISNEDETIWGVFNGEIYNFRVLRRRLEAKGHKFRTEGDAEVLVHLYEDAGEAMFSQLRGMFALAIWDAPRRTLVLARDRLGQKPLVYRRTDDRLIFASELKALLALSPKDVPRRVDPMALDRYLTYGYIPQPRTILEGVDKLRPAHYAVWRDGDFRVERYWSPDWNHERRRSFDDDAAELRETLGEAVREQMAADVPLGAFLSGGIDSTLIVGLMQKAASRPVKTFSIGFTDAAFDETAYAEEAARFLGTEHHKFIIEPNAWETLPALARQFDEPFADSSALPTWRVAQETRRHVTVALTGDAGDELFGGYDRYRALAISEAFHRLPATPRRWIAGAVARLLPQSGKAKSRLRAAQRFFERINEPAVDRYLGWMTTFDENERFSLYDLDQAGELFARDNLINAASLLGLAFWKADGRDPVTRAMVSDILMYLPGDLLFKVDMASMAHGLECRAPFLDHRVVELALAMPIDRKLRLRPGRSKVILKRAFADLIPPSIQTRRKMGFGVPVGRWFRNELRDELTEVLLDRSTLDRGLFRPEAIRSLVDEHLSGRRERGHQLWALLMLELWMRNYLDSN